MWAAVEGLNVVLLPREGARGQPRCAVKGRWGSEQSESNKTRSSSYSGGWTVLLVNGLCTL